MQTTSVISNSADTDVGYGPYPHPVEFHFPHLRRGTTPRTALAFQALASPEPEADTFGWDTVFAISITDANRAILRAGVSPPSFHFEDTDGTTIQGSFGPWQICRGGDGDLITFTIPITTGDMRFDGKGYALASASVIMEVRLHYLPQSPASRPPRSADVPLQQETQHNLVLRTTSVNADDPPVTVREVRLGDQSMPQVAQWVMEGILQAWFVANLEAFSHVFATVTLNRKVDHDGFQWLAPQYTGYAYFDGTTDENSYLGVLCMTQRPNADGLAPQLSRTAIPKKPEPGF